MNYLTYVISSVDTLENIALGQLGSTDISGIIQLNNLRYPYISDNQIDQYGRAKGNLQMVGPVNSRTQSCTFQNHNSLPVAQLDTVFIEEWTTGSYEAVVISGITYNADGSVVLQFQTPVVNSYSIAARVTLFTNQENIITRVAKTGDTILLPISSVSTNAFLAAQNSDPFGTDIQVDDAGFIVKSGGDWATVSGIQNVQQAVLMRWRTPQGSLPNDVTYGNRVFELLGETNEPYFLQLAQSYLQQAALSDPRVSGVSNLEISPGQSADQIVISSEVQVSNSPVSFNVSSPLTFR